LVLQASKFISKENLVKYLNLYKNVEKEIHSTTPIPVNWETWCLERYDCNSMESMDVTINDTRIDKQ